MGIKTDGEERGMNRVVVDVDDSVQIARYDTSDLHLRSRGRLTTQKSGLFRSSWGGGGLAPGARSRNKGENQKPFRKR